MFSNKIKLVLASYFQPENHGHGVKYGISPSKPKDIDCEYKFEELSPEELYWDYHKTKHTNPDAGVVFVEGFKDRLDKFRSLLITTAKEDGKSIHELLPFKDGDTLLSWENKGNTTYRKHVAEFLRDIGYEVVEN